MEQNLAQNGNYELLPEVFNYIDSVEEKEKAPVEYVAPEVSNLSEFKEKYMTGKEVMAKDKKVYIEEELETLGWREVPPVFINKRGEEGLAHGIQSQIPANVRSQTHSITSIEARDGVVSGISIPQIHDKLIT